MHEWYRNKRKKGILSPWKQIEINTGRRVVAVHPLLQLSLKAKTEKDYISLTHTHTQLSHSKWPIVYANYVCSFR